MLNLLKSLKLRRAQVRLADTNERLIAAYDRLLDPLCDTDFSAYCAKYGADHDALLEQARARLAAQAAETDRRRAERRAAGIGW